MKNQTQEKLKKVDSSFRKLTKELKDLHLFALENEFPKKMHYQLETLAMESLALHTQFKLIEEDIKNLK